MTDRRTQRITRAVFNVIFEATHNDYSVNVNFIVTELYYVVTKREVKNAIKRLLAAKEIEAVSDKEPTEYLTLHS